MPGRVPRKGPCPVTALPLAASQVSGNARAVALSLCDRILSRLVSSVGDTRYRRYFEPSARLRIDGGVLAVAVPSPFHADLLERQFGAVLRTCARQESGVEGMTMRWEVMPLEFAAASANEAATALEAGTIDSARVIDAPGVPDAGVIATIGPRTAQAEEPLKSRLNGAAVPRLRLEDFVVGESNRLAFNAATRLAEEEGQRGPFGVLFIHGPTGVGKTHLLQGIARRFGERRPRARVRYVTGEQFVNEYIASVHAGNIEGFRARYRGLDLLCLDDVHFLGGKEKTQSEFQHTFDVLDLGGARVALVSDEHPRLLQRLTRQITSRFVSGMVVKVDAPDEATRVGLVRMIAARRGIALDDGSVRAIAGARRASVREVEGAVLRVEAMTRLMGHEPSAGIPIAAVARALAEDGAPGSGGVRKPLRMAHILAVVCERLGVDQTDVLGRGRHKRVVLARSLAALLARELTTHSYPEIARALGRDNHSTVVTACQRLKKAIEANATCDCGPGMDGPLDELVQSVKVETVQRA
jgi:chromosomal replication initiator protein